MPRIIFFAFVDVNDRKAGKIIEGVKIYKMSSLPGLLKRNRVDKVVIAKKDDFS